MYKGCNFPSFFSTFSSLNQPKITIKPAFVHSAFQHPQSLPNPNNNHLQHALQPSHLGRRRLCLSANQRNRPRSALRCWRHTLCSRCWLLCRELDGADCLRQFPGFMHEQRTVRIQHLRGRSLQRLSRYLFRGSVFDISDHHKHSCSRCAACSVIHRCSSCWIPPSRSSMQPVCEAKPVRERRPVLG